MIDKFLNKLEYNKILNILQTFAKTNMGKNSTLNLKPSFDSKTVQLLLDETTEAKELLENNGSLPIEELPDLASYLPVLNSHNALSIKGIRDICSILKMSRELREYFAFANSANYPILSNYFSLLYINSKIEKNINSKILDETTVDDKASPKLYSIRKEQKQIKLNIREKLNYFVHSTTYSKYLQDNVITIRNERFVIPVKEEFKGQVKGFVHDISASGSTIFIEPLSVFELNNKLTSLIAEENIEILKILEELSSSLFPIITELSSTFELIGKLDFIFAKAKYSNSINAISPIISNEKYINLISARHPLINSNVVVPIDINLGYNFSSLIITGPNTGGKSVALKTTRTTSTYGAKWITYTRTPR